MTNPNSASSNNPHSADLSRDILDKVNAHADRSIDKLFADIDELLQTDTAQDTHSVNTERPFYSNSSSFAPAPPNSETPFTPPNYSPPFTPPNAETPFTPPNYSPSFTPPNAETPFTPPNYSPPFTPPNAETPFTPPNPPSAREAKPANADTPFTPPNYFQPPTPQTYSNQPQPSFAPPQEDELESNPKSSSGIPLWAKVFLSIGFISIASSTALLWLIKEGKISPPSNVNTSWLLGEPKSQISPEDAKFADYMRKSISKIESANTQPALTSNSRAVSSATTTESDPATNAPTPIAPPAIPATEIAPLKTTVSLTKTMQSGDRIGATFQIGKRSETVNVGDKIGKTGWSLSSVAENSIIVVKAGRENKSIAIGQKF
jgi:hypothetical protein